MSHVDEGALHAYLDGALEDYPTGEARRIRAHLERCPSCSAALAEARSLRDAAESVLATPTLNVTPPPLEELRRLARSGDGARPGSSAWPLGARIYRLGWAASVVLALGIGWTLRGGGPGGSPEADFADRTAAAEAAGPSESAPTALTDAVEGPATGAPARPSGVDPTRAEEAERLAERETGTDVGFPSAASRTAQAAPIPSVADDDVSSAEEELTLNEVAGVLTADARAAGSSAGAPDVAEPTVAAPALTGAVEQDSRKATVAAAPMPVAAEAPADAGATATEARNTLAARSEVVGAGLAQARLDGRQRTSDAVARDGEPGAEQGSLVVPELEVLSIVWREEGVTPAGVRVLQRLEDGGVLELIHLPEGIAPDSVEPADRGMSELVVPREQGWLILRGPVSEAELADLLKRLEAPPPV